MTALLSLPRFKGARLDTTLTAGSLRSPGISTGQRRPLHFPHIRNAAQKSANPGRGIFLQFTEGFFQVRIFDPVPKVAFLGTTDAVQVIEFQKEGKEGPMKTRG